MSDDAGSLRDAAHGLLPGAVELRRRLHRRPELGLVLPETQKTVLEALDGLDVEITTGGSTSAVLATLQGERPGKTILLRADMDALPMPEETGLEFASEHEGRMHACGHDAHTAMLVGAARLLSERRGDLAGTVKFLFQPGEEGFGGARILIEEGLLEAAPRVDAAFAIHVDSTLRPGAVLTRPGPFLASADVFSIDLKGRGGHGSMPHQTIDPVPAAAEIVMALQSFVTRRVDAFDPAVVSVTKLEAGTTHNVIPETAHLLGTLRTVSERTRERVRAGIRRVAEGVAMAHGVEATFHLLPGYPVTANDERFTAFTQEVAGRVLGDDAIVPMPAPFMGAEDFSYILDRVPGTMVFLGVRPPGERAEAIHSNKMILEESAMAAGIALHAGMALSFLGS